MEEFFNKPILDQVYDSINEDFEQSVYDTNKEIKEIESKVAELSEKLTTFLKQVIPNEQDYDKAWEMFRDYDLKYSREIEFWAKEYFKLGMTDRKILLKELFADNAEEKDEDTFINYELNELSEYIEAQKRKYTFGTEEYKELQRKYNVISEKYPNVIEVFEDLKPIVLTEEEMKALVELREIDIDMGCMEKNLCFKLGIKEVFNF